MANGLCCSPELGRNLNGVKCHFHCCHMMTGHKYPISVMSLNHSMLKCAQIFKLKAIIPEISAELPSRLDCQDSLSFKSLHIDFITTFLMP